MTGLRLLAAAFVMHLVLILPAAPMPAGQALLRIAPELPLILLGLPLLGRVGRVAVFLALSVLAVQKIADLAMIAALGRPFNILADMALIGAGADLLAQSLGMVRLLAGSAALAVAVLAAGAALWWATGTWSRLAWRPAGRLVLLSVAPLLVLA